MARSAAARFRLDEIRGVTVNVEAHVTSLETDDGVRLHGHVEHEHFCLLDGVSGWRSLLGTNFVELNKNHGVDGMRNVEEGTSNTLHACDAVFIKFWCGCGVWGVLYLGPVHWRKPFVGRVLGASGHTVLEALQGFCGQSWAWRC